MANWQRWLRYGKAKLDDTLQQGNDELDRREAQLEADAADKPWLRSTAEAPTLDEVRARIEHEAASAGGDAEVRPGVPAPAPPVPPVDLGGIDFAEQQRQADARLATIRSELGLDAAGTPKDAGGPADPPPAGPEPPVT